MERFDIRAGVGAARRFLYLASRFAKVHHSIFFPIEFHYINSTTLQRVPERFNTSS
jgi:hypothetical protein